MVVICVLINKMIGKKINGEKREAANYSREI